MKRYIDEFCKLPADKMAQKISDMTYSYNATTVPKTHYKKLLQKEVIELLAQDSTIENVLLTAVTNQLQALQKESAKLFFKALVCVDLGIKPEQMDTLTFEALEVCYQFHGQTTHFLHQTIIEDYRRSKGEN